MNRVNKRTQTHTHTHTAHHVAHIPHSIHLCVVSACTECDKARNQKLNETNPLDGWLNEWMHA